MPQAAGRMVVVLIGPTPARPPRAARHGEAKEGRDTPVSVLIGHAVDGAQQRERLGVALGRGVRGVHNGCRRGRGASQQWQ